MLPVGCDLPSCITVIWLQRYTLPYRIVQIFNYLLDYTYELAILLD